MWRNVTVQGGMCIGEGCVQGGMCREECAGECGVCVQGKGVCGDCSPV